MTEMAGGPMKGPTDLALGDGPPDDPSISNDALLLRRIPPWHYDPRRPKPVSSNAFDDDPDGGSMSVYVQDRLTALGGTPVDPLAGHDGYGIGTLSVFAVRNEGFGVVYRPLDETALGQAHAEVHCKKTDGKKKHLRDAFLEIRAPVT